MGSFKTFNTLISKMGPFKTIDLTNQEAKKSPGMILASIYVILPWVRLYYYTGYTIQAILYRLY